VAEGTEYYTIRFSAEAVQLVFFRYGLDQWLQALDWPEAERVDVILAVSEASTNAVEYAYPVGEPGEVEVVGRLVLGQTDRHVVIAVRDWGTWQGSDSDGYGLTAVRACMARVRIRHDADGTLVTMSSRPVPQAAAVAPQPRSSAEDEPVRPRLRRI